MKKLLVWGLAALPLLALPARAWSWDNGHLNLIFHPLPPNWSQLGPWYLYWPMSAHFVAPAPTGYPYWPSAQGLPGMAFGGPQGPGAPQGGMYAPQGGMYAPQGGAYVPPGGAYAVPPGSYAPPAPTLPTPVPVPSTTPVVPPVPATVPPAIKPAGYYPAGYSVPSYWYDR
jgi:hypothetical protein